MTVGEGDWMDLRSRLACSIAWVVLESGLGNGVGKGIQGKASEDAKCTRADHGCKS